MQDMEARLDAARRQLEAVVAEREAQKLEVVARETELANLRDQIRAAGRQASEAGAAGAALAELRATLAGEQMRREAALGEIAAGAAARRALDVELKSANAAADALRAELAAAKDKIASLEARLAAAPTPALPAPPAAATDDDRQALLARISALEAAAMAYRPPPTMARSGSLCSTSAPLWRNSRATKRRKQSKRRWRCRSTRQRTRRPRRSSRSYRSRARRRWASPPASAPCSSAILRPRAFPGLLDALCRSAPGQGRGLWRWPYPGYGRAEDRRIWPGADRPFGFPADGRPLCRPPCPMRRLRAAAPSVRIARASGETGRFH